MLHWSFIRVLNKYTIFQYILGYFPMLLVGVYMIFYLYDLGGVVSVVNVNGEIANRSYQMGRLREVDSYKRVGGFYELNVLGEAKQVKAGVGDIIYKVRKISDDCYCIYYTEDEFLQVESIKMLGIDIDIDKDLFVILNEDGAYHIEYDGQSRDMDSIYNISMIGTDKDKYDFEVSSGYITTVKDLNVNFGDNLPSDSIYYDELSKSCIRNASSDFATNFIIGSNILVVMFSMAIYVVLIRMVIAKDELTVLSNKNILKVNVICICFLPILIAFTIFIF